MKNGIENIILSCFTKIGDRVMVNTDDKDQHGWANGLLGTVIGYYECITYETINSYPWRKPGKYRSNGNPYVLWDSGTVDRPSLHDICFADEVENHTHDIRAKDMVYRELFETHVWIDDLPKTKYNIGNIVQLVSSEFFESFGTTVVIESIDYYRVGEFCSDDITPYPVYRIRSIDGGGSTSVRDLDIIKVISPGNYWFWQNDKSKLAFKDLKDEVSFYVSIGKVREVKNPKTNDYAWTIDEAVDAVQKGDVDVIKMSSGFFGALPSLSVMKFEEGFEVLAQRVRRVILEGFTTINDINSNQQ